MSRFEEFAAHKRREAAAARIQRLSTVLDRREKASFLGLGNEWTRAHYGGDFDVAAPADGRTALSLVFVQSKDGNTGGPDPAALGGGATDQHLIYEGLSRVAADAVLAGAATVHQEAFFSVWHPELIALRHALGLPRHPAQVVVSRRGRVNPDAVLFNAPEVPVFLIAGPEWAFRREAWLVARPWVRHIPLLTEDLRPAIEHLRTAEGIRRISAIGGRFTATRLVDAGLAQDLYLTTTAGNGGEPGTPWYAGAAAPGLELVTKKQWLCNGEIVGFEHLSITPHQSSSSACPPPVE